MFLRVVRQFAGRTDRVASADRAPTRPVTGHSMLCDSQHVDDPRISIDFAVAARSRSFALGKSLQAGDVTLAFGRFDANEGAHVRFPKMTLAVHSGASVNMDWRSPGSDRTKSTIVSRGKFMLSDAGVQVWKRWTMPRSIFAFAIDRAFVARIAEQIFDGASHGAIDTRVGMNDPVISGIASLARWELDNGGANGRLYLEHLASSLAVRLLQRFEPSSRIIRAPKGGLTPRQLRRVTDYIDAHLGDDLGLAELATVASLSANHFGDAFRASTGHPPHRYVMAVRVRRARELLCDQGLSLSEIAYMVGFSSQSHFTTQFGRIAGISPGRFRRSQK